MTSETTALMPGERFTIEDRTEQQGGRKQTWHEVRDGGRYLCTCCEREDAERILTALRTQQEADKPSDAMVERVARVIGDVELTDPYIGQTTLSGIIGMGYVKRVARAAIASLSLADDTLALLRDIRACRKPLRAVETIHGTVDRREAWSISGLTALLPRIDTALAKQEPRDE